MIPMLDTKKILVLSLCVLLTAGAWVEVVTTERENWLPDADHDREVRVSGTRNDPILIRDVNDLQSMRNDLTAHYALANDIDATATKEWNDRAGFEPVGPGPLDKPDHHFLGTFDGRGYTITGLFIDRPSTDNVGLFGFVGWRAVVANVRIEDANITGNNNVGILAGYTRYSFMDNCSTTGNVTGMSNVGGVAGHATYALSFTGCSSDATVSGYHVAGGLVGYVYRGSISNSHATGSVSTTGGNSGGLVGRIDRVSISKSYATGSMTGAFTNGGLVGRSTWSTITNCYATGNVSGESWLGGFVGYFGDGTLSESYATGMVTRSSGSYTQIGGFVGTNDGTIIHCYSTGRVTFDNPPPYPVNHGFAGVAHGGGLNEMNRNYWDTQTSWQTGTAGEAGGLTTAEMKTRRTFMDAGWDFETVWCMMNDITYPLLRWQFQVWHVDIEAPAGGNGTTVHPFDRIQDAVNAASDLDSINVSAGVYRENVVVNRSVEIIGHGPVIVEAEHPSDTPVRITAPSASLVGLGIRNPGGTGMVIEADHVLMGHCAVTGGGGGIRVINGSRNIEVHHSNIFATSGYAMDASDNQGIPVHATTIWWGHPSGPYHPVLNLHGRGGSVSDNVVFDPWRVLPRDHRTLHVSSSGNDTHGTGEMDQPYRTIGRATDAAAEWDDIMVAAGVYPEDLMIRSHGITIRGDPGGGTVLDAGGTDDGVIIVVDDITLRNLTIRNAPESGVSVINSSWITISDCIFSGNALDLNLTNSTGNRLINTTFETVHFSDPNSTLSVLWPLDLRVTDQRSGFIPDARIRISDRFGTVVFEGRTGDRGILQQVTLREYEQNLTSTVRYDPYTIRVRKDGYLNFTEEVDITSYTRLTCVMEEHILPVARITGEMIRHVNMDSRISFDGSGSTGRSITFFWDFGDGNTSVSPAPSHTYTVPGAYQVTLTVTDDYGNTSTAFVAVMVKNVPPSAWAQTSSTTAFEDDTIEFDARLSWDTPSDSLTYLWDFGDGTRSNDSVTTHSFARAGTYDVSLTVTDRYGGTDTDTLSVTIRNVTPWILSTEVSGELHPGKVLTFRGYAEDTPSDMAGLRYTWDLGDGTLTEGRNVTHVYSRTGTYAVNLTVTDDDGATDRSTLEITIAVPGVEARASNHLILQDGTVSFNASHELDDGTFTYLWHFGDSGSVEGRNVSHTYTRSGVFTPWLVISHGDGAKGNTTVFLGEITVENVVPGPVIRVDTLRVDQDEPVTFDASGTTDSPSDLPILTYIWDFGDGTGGGGVTMTHTFTRAGPYQVTLHVSDGKVTNTSRVTVEVVNVPPTANAGAEKERTAVAGEPVILDASASTGPPSNLPGLNFTWTVGNETLYGKVFLYTFDIPGAYNVTLRVRDEDGAVSEDTITFDVVMPVEPEKEEEGMMTGFAWFLLVVVVVLLLVLLFVLSGKGFEPPVEIGELAEEVVVEEAPNAIRPEKDNAMFKPPSEATPEPITGEKEEGVGKDGDPVAGEKEELTGKDGEPDSKVGEHDRTLEPPGGPGELADTVEGRNEMGEKRASESGDHTPHDPVPPEDRSPPPPPQDRPPSV